MDASAWIEYLRGTSIGRKIQGLIENDNSTIITPNIVCAEVLSKTARDQEDTLKAIQAIIFNSILANEEQSDYFEAGILHASIRKEHEGISIADAIIITIAKKHQAKIITTDFHLKNEEAAYFAQK